MAQLIENKISRRYARALIELAIESKKLDKIMADMRDMQGMLGKSEDLAAFVASPLPKRAERIAVMEALAEKAKFKNETRHFLMLLAEHRRLDLLPTIISVLDSMAKEIKGIRDIEIISPIALGKTQEKNLASGLSKAIGFDVAITNRVDPSILGGVVMRYGSVMVDDSLKNKLERLTHTMKGTA